MAFYNQPNDEVLFNPATRYSLYHRFERLPALKAVLDTYTASVAAAEAVATNVANKDFSLLGTGAVTADLSFYADGGINLATHGGATDSAIIVPQLSTSQSPWTGITWGTSKEVWWGCHVRTNTALTNTTLWAGLKKTNTPVSTTDDDEVFFRYQNGTDTYWQCVYDIANAGPTSTSSTVTVAASTEYALAIKIDSSRVARFFIDGNLMATTTALTSLNLIPYIGVLSATDATAKTLVVRDQFISRNIA